MRIDTTSASGYWQVTEDGLFQLGHSKDHRPDLPQLKVFLATLDPMGMPVATQVVGGNLADDPLYIPAIDQVRQGIGERGLLYIGDCKMMSLETRAHLEAGDDDYLGPFSLVQVSEATLDGYLSGVWTGEPSLKSVKRRGADSQLQKVAEGFELSENVTAVMEEREVRWLERRLVLHSLAHAKAAEAALGKRLQKAQSALEALAVRKQGKEPFSEAESLRQAADKLLEHYDVQELLKIHITEHVQPRIVRKYGDHPAETRLAQKLTLNVQRDESAIQKTIRRLGAVISHELKNSLNALGMGFDSPWRSRRSKIPHLGRWNAQVREEVIRLRALTDELLLFARMLRLNVEPDEISPWPSPRPSCAPSRQPPRA